MAPNNTTASTCSSDYQNASYIVHTVMPPFHLILGVCGHLLTLLAFHKKSKEERVYSYQIFCTVSELVHIFCLDAVIYYTYHLNGSSASTSADWFTHSYLLMWYGSRLCGPLLQMATTNTVLASVAMSVDRFIALKSPPTHQKLDTNKWYKGTIFSLIIFISVSTSIFDCFRNYLVQNSTGRYDVVRQISFVTSTFAQFSNYVRNILRAVGLLALIISNALVVYVYRKANKVYFLMAPKDVQQEQQRRKREKGILFLTLTQSISTSFAISAEMSFLCVAFMAPTWIIACGNMDLVITAVDATIQSANVLNFYGTLAINKQFRRTLFDLFRSRKTAVTALSAELNTLRP